MKFHFITENLKMNSKDFSDFNNFNLSNLSNLWLILLKKKQQKNLKKIFIYDIIQNKLMEVNYA
jgi:hypothetical protein